MHTLEHTSIFVMCVPLDILQFLLEEAWDLELDTFQIQF